MARVLLADDDADVRALVEFKLARGGHDVTVAGDGVDALEQARHDLPDVVLLDVQMPGMTGPDVVRALRADPETAGLRIVLLTAQTADGDLRRGLDGGADAYVAKPFSPGDLLRQVDELLERTP